MSSGEFWMKLAAGAVVVLLVLAAMGYGVAGLGVKRGQSEYTGHVVDVVEDRGVVFTPSWANMKTSPRSSDIQSFCITPAREDELVPKFYEAMKDGGRYTVTYERPLWVSPSTCRNEDAIVTDIQPVNSTEAGVDE